MIALLLIQKLFQLFVFIFAGAICVKTGVIKAEHSTALSLVSIYILMPGTMLSVFQTPLTSELVRGLLLCTILAAIIHIALIIFTHIVRKPLRWCPSEQGSIIYSNAANLIIPIVSYMLGDQWVTYTTPFLVVQCFFLFSHGRSLFSDEKPGIFKMFWNPTIIAIGIGLVMMLTGIQFPELIRTPLDMMKDMLGPFAMLITGILIGSMDIPKFLKMPRLYMTLIFRLIICPGIIFVLLTLFHVTSMIPNGNYITLVVFLATMTPAASTIVQFAQVYSDEGEYAGAINVMTTLCSIISMPIWVYIFEMMN